MKTSTGSRGHRTGIPVGVVTPYSAQVTCPLEHDEVIDSLALERTRHGQSGEAAAHDCHAEVVARRLRLGAGGLAGGELSSGHRYTRTAVGGPNLGDRSL